MSESVHGGRVGGLLGNSSVYMASNMLQRGLAFVLIPLYAAYFSAAEFGAMDMLYQAVLTGSILISLGLPQGLLRGFFPPGSAGSMPDAERRLLMGALATLMVILTGLATTALLLCANPIARALFQGHGKAEWVRLAAWLLLAVVMQQLPLQLYKTLGRSRIFAAWSLASFLLVAAGNLYLIVDRHWGLEGMLWGNILGVGGTAIGLWILMLPRIRFNFGWRRLGPLFAFGLPMLPNLLCRKVLETANRYLLPLTWGLSEVGLFSMGARVSSILDFLLLVPFLYAWQPFFYSLAGSKDAPRTIARVTHYYLIVLLTACLALQCLQEPVLAFLGRGKFAGAGPAASWMLLAVLCNGLQYCVSAGIHLRKKLVAEMLLMVAAGAVGLGLNFLLIPRWGAAGAAAATAAGYLLYLLASFWLAQSVYSVPYLWGRGVWVALPAVGACAALWACPGAAARGIILVTYLIMGPLTDLLRHGELAALATGMNRRLRRVAVDPA